MKKVKIVIPDTNYLTMDSARQLQSILYKYISDAHAGMHSTRSTGLCTYVLNTSYSLFQNLYAYFLFQNIVSTCFEKTATPFNHGLFTPSYVTEHKLRSFHKNKKRLAFAVQLAKELEHYKYDSHYPT